MKKILKKVSLLLVILAFSLLFKCSEATKVGGVNDKVTVDLYTMESGKKAVLVSPNKAFSAKDGKLYKSDLDTFCNANNIQITSIKNKDNEAELATGDILVNNDGSEMTLILCGDADRDGGICSIFDYRVIIDDYLNKQKADENQKVAANLYNADNRLNVFDIKIIINKYIGLNDKIGNTLLYSWSKEDSKPGEYSIKLTTSGTNETTVGGTFKVTAEITPSTANQSVTYESGDTSIATVDQNGTVTGVKIGETTITAKSTTIKNPETGEYLSATIKAKIKENSIHVSQLNVSIDNRMLEVGETAQITTEIIPNNATYKNVRFESTNSSIVTVDSTGKVTAVAPGEATIKISIPEETNMQPSEILVTVSSDIKITGITVLPHATSIYVGEQLTLQLSIDPENATNKTINWTSSDTSIATVDSNGTVTALKEGTVTISFRTTDGSDLGRDVQLTVVALPTE